MLIYRSMANHTPMTYSTGAFRREFGLDDDEYNQWLARRLLADSAWVEREPPFARPTAYFSSLRWLSRVEREQGRYFLVADNQATPPRIIHHARFSKTYVRWLKAEVIERVQLWSFGAHPDTYHDHLVLTEWLLPRRLVATDLLLAEDSCRFWYNRLASAQARGIPLAMIDWVHQRAECFDPMQWPAFRYQAREKNRLYSNASVLIGLDTGTGTTPIP